MLAVGTNSAKVIQQNNFDLTTPEWVANSVVYQIFPDRFRRSGRVEEQSPLTLREWGSDPKTQGFHGGDLYGVIDSLDYLESLGVNCIYLNPVFSSTANHRYHTYDYFKVDPLLGGNLALQSLIESLHQRQMRIILDGVFNHCSRGFWPFNHLLENGQDSPYKDWFHIYKWPLCPYPNDREDCGYGCWWNDPALPKFNHHHPPVRDYLIRVACYWIEQGIDGWRLDVPDELPIDFWVEFRQKVKSLSPDIWIVGEVWGDARPWLNRSLFDGVMNYRLGWSTLCWVAGSNLNKTYTNPSYPLRSFDSQEFLDVLKTTSEWYSSEINRCQFNLLDSHDVPRALNTLKGDLYSLKIALFMLFLYPGAPCIYYGTEVGLQGGEEPACRESFPWDKPWDLDLREYIQSLCRLREILPVSLRESMQWESIGVDGLFIYSDTEKNSSLSQKPSLSIWINRNRSSSLQIKQLSSNYQVIVGTFQVSHSLLSPQSAVIFF